MSVLLKPHITEKASALGGEGTYSFVVTKGSNKKEIEKAVREMYKVTPLRVNIINVPSKKIRGRKGIKGVRSGYKKAVVFLKQGEKIEFV